MIDLSRNYQKKRNNLLIITNHFPFGKGEPFLEIELPFLARVFDNVIIVSRDIKSTGEKPTPGNVTCYRVDPQSDYWEKISACILYVKNLPSVIQLLYDEYQSLKQRQQSITLPIIMVALHDITKAIITAHHVKKILKKQPLDGHLVLYSYWLTNSALALAFVSSAKLTLKKISRAHGGDLYEWRNNLKYLSFRKVLADKLDRIFTVSLNGAEHLKNQVSAKFHSKIVTSRLGTSGGNYKQTALPLHRKPALLVSCSFMVPVKQINLIVDALSHINLPLHWMHIGDGPLKDEIETYAADRLSTSRNISYTFTGSKTNRAILDFYENNFVHLFINTSASEGIPVSIMEAQSFGIPVLAPAVGGIPEIVSNETGRLFSPNVSPKTIADFITDILTCPDEVYLSLRRKAFINWQTNYNADKNFSSFVANISTL